MRVSNTQASRYSSIALCFSLLPTSGPPPMNIHEAVVMGTCGVLNLIGSDSALLYRKCTVVLVSVSGQWSVGFEWSMLLGSRIGTFGLDITCVKGMVNVTASPFINTKEM